MRVLMVMNKMVAGGAETTALELIRALEGRGVEFVVATMYRGGELGERFAACGAKLHEGMAHRRIDLLAPLRVARIIRRGSIDAVIILDVARNSFLYGLTGAALSGRSVPKMLWCHAIPDGNTGDFVPRLKAFMAGGALDLIVCISRHQRAVLASRGLPRRRMPLIRNGVDLSRFGEPSPAGASRVGGASAPSGKHVIVQVGNLAFYKDHATLVGAAGSLARRRDDFQVLLVGRDTDSAAMTDAVAKAGAAGCVKLMGQRNDVPSILAGADLFVLATKCEVFNVAALEAMAAGLPVVVSDVPGFDEVFTHGVEGLRVPPGDADALAAAIEKLLDDRALRDRLASAGRKRVERFSVPRMAGNFTRLLRAVCKRR